MAMVAPTVELAEYYPPPPSLVKFIIIIAEYYTHVDSYVYVYAFNHHKLPDPAIYQARTSHHYLGTTLSSLFINSLKC